MSISRESLFLSTVKDIRSRIDAKDPYDLLMISALLRKLFFDGAPLIDQVNSKHRLKLRFKVGTNMYPPDPPEIDPRNVMWSLQDSLDPETAPPFMRTAELNKDEFAGYTIMNVWGQTYSIRDVILFEANVVGAVHAGATRTDKEAALLKLEDELHLGGYAPALRQLTAIGRVVLRALNPLVEAVNANAAT